MLIIKKFIILFFVLFFSSTLFSNENNFIYEIAMLKWDSDSYTVLPTKRIVHLDDGNKFQIYLKSDKDIFCYIIYEDINKNIIPFYNSKLEMNKEYFFPSKNNHFQVEPPGGQEKFHILLSLEKLENIESMLINGQSIELLDAIIKIKKSKTSFGEAPERPVPMGGVSRGENKLEASSFSGDSSYVKTIRFKH